MGNIFEITSINSIVKDFNKSHRVLNGLNVNGVNKMKYSIWVTTDCNLRCLYCYEGQEKQHLSISRQVSDDILRFMQRDLIEDNNKELLIDFHGGEPFLNIQEIKYLVRKILEKFGQARKVQFATTTNATIMEEDILDFIVQYIPDVSVSLDGTERTHNF